MWPPDVMKRASHIHNFIIVRVLWALRVFFQPLEELGCKVADDDVSTYGGGEA